VCSQILQQGSRTRIIGGSFVVMLGGISRAA
jgi:hypothetical protein